jgi:hypothetical protein
MTPVGFNGEEWMDVLAALSRHLPPDGPPVSLCLIGSAACLFAGMPGRTSMDLDIWKPESHYDRLELMSAARSAGLAFDPKETLEPDTPYLQVVEPGLAEVGPFVPVLVDRLGRLEVFRAPPVNLIAGKLIRSEPKDLDDIRFLLARYPVGRDDVLSVIGQFSRENRMKALENAVYLEVLFPEDSGEA